LPPPKTQSGGVAQCLHQTPNGHLRLKGRPIPENDLWIAAMALEHDLVLATRDAHFGEIDNLKVEMWLNQ